MTKNGPMGTTSRGRPQVQETADDIVASVLATAGPRVGTPAYSTRRIAELTGLSQTVVSRAVRRIRQGGPAVVGPREWAQLPVLQLAQLRVEFPRIMVVFEPSAELSAPRPTVFERRAATLVSALWVSGAAAWPPQANEEHGAATDEELELTAVWDPAGVSWEAFLRRVSHLLSACAKTPDSVPSNLLKLLAARAGRGLHGVEWRRGSAGDHEIAPISDSDSLVVAEYPAPGRSSSNRWLPRVELSATEQIAIALRKEMMNSGFRAGDRLSVAALAETLGLPTATVRTAMRQLADDGLLIPAQGGFRIPAVTGADVIDLYAARLQVGTVILRGCAAQPRHRLLPARLALGALEAAAARGTRTDVGEADLRFQQELAEASGLEQSARSFHALTLRVRMFISVLQLDYTPAADRLVNDDRRILSAALEGRAAEAVRVWRSKQDNAVRHMSALAPESFDAALWERLSA